MAWVVSPGLPYPGRDEQARDGSTAAWVGRQHRQEPSGVLLGRGALAHLGPWNEGGQQIEQRCGKLRAHGGLRELRCGLSVSLERDHVQAQQKLHLRRVSEPHVREQVGQAGGVHSLHEVVDAGGDEAQVAEQLQRHASQLALGRSLSAGQVLVYNLERALDERRDHGGEWIDTLSTERQHVHTFHASKLKQRRVGKRESLWLRLVV